MRRGCIAVGEVHCDGCRRSLEYGERYLVIDDEEGQGRRFCVDCCLSRGYASYRMEKGEKVITFFPEIKLP
jgi:nitrate reductase beta subunit